MLNTGAAIIIKLIKHGNDYHLLAQSFNGKIYHEKFTSEEEARQWLAEHNLVIDLLVEEI